VTAYLKLPFSESQTEGARRGLQAALRAPASTAPSKEELPMRILFATVLAALAACSSPSQDSSGARSATAQAIVDRAAGQHAEIARLSIHAIPPGESSPRIVASTVAGRLGEPSDPEDVRALDGGEEIVLQEGKNLDYTMPVRDQAGRTLAVIGITISGTTGGKDAMLARAKELANELAGELRAAKIW
jgi:hypothetical protein